MAYPKSYELDSLKSSGLHLSITGKLNIWLAFQKLIIG